MLEWERCHNQDSRSFGGLFYQFCEEIQDLDYETTLRRLMYYFMMLLDYVPEKLANYSTIKSAANQHHLSFLFVLTRSGRMEVSMNIRRLKYFISVADNLNFTKAAEKCYVAETVISRNVAMLEEEVGFKVFERNNRMVKLTPVGEIFLKEVTFIVDHYEKTVRDCQTITEENSNILRVGFVSPFEKWVIADILSEFIELYPGTQLIVTQCIYKLIIEILKRGELDIVFFEPFNNLEYPAELEIIPIAEKNYCTLMSKSNPLADQKKLTLSMIANEKIIINCPVWEVPNDLGLTKKLCQDFGLQEKQLIICSGGVDAALIMAELNMGIYLVTSGMKYNIMRETLIFVDVDESFPKYAIVAAYLKPNKKIVSALLNFLNKKSKTKTAQNDRTDAGAPPVIS